MFSWGMPVAFVIAYFGGSMAQIVYTDVRGQGKSKLVAGLYSLIPAVLSCIIFTLVLTLSKWV